ncbi:MAG: hypothetical protein HC879_05490 [Leptolyngbyaceae cyanobacterium SL_5_9]|nr:hypothetical protein [Leptolyngbyaceae cyanobacterium SL_5_9]
MQEKQYDKVEKFLRNSGYHREGELKILKLILKNADKPSDQLADLLINIQDFNETQFQRLTAAMWESILDFPERLKQCFYDDEFTASVVQDIINREVWDWQFDEKLQAIKEISLGDLSQSDYREWECYKNLTEIEIGDLFIQGTRVMAQYISEDLASIEFMSQGEKSQYLQAFSGFLQCDIPNGLGSR